MRDALDAVFPRWDGLAVAGRTDAGVHATGQVASVDVEGGPPADRLADALNAALPEDVAVRAADEAPEDFHARFSARSRSYRYRVLVGAAARRSRRAACSGGRDRSTRRRCAAAAALVVGEHDFRAFTPTETQHEVFVRNVSAAAWERDGDRLDFTITADSFLRHMVRTLVGTMLEAGPSAPIGSASCSRVVPAPRPVSPRRRGASTSSEVDVLSAAATTRPHASGYDRARALPDRPLRPRRHADRLRADHPRVDAARGRHACSVARSRPTSCG